MNTLQQSGFAFEVESGKHFDVKLSAIICDAPVRAFLKCIKSHTGNAVSDVLSTGSDKTKLFYQTCHLCLSMTVFLQKQTHTTTQEIHPVRSWVV